MNMKEFLSDRFFNHSLTTIVGALSATCIYLAPIILSGSLPMNYLLIGGVVFFIGALSKDPPSSPV